MRALLGLLVLLLFSSNCSVEGRAVNISNEWILPQEEFPVFYRYFRDSISWYEADAVCQFHHGNLVTVDTAAQYDAVRAYLKELDVSVNVWIGLIKDNPNTSFIWTNSIPQTGDGYWQIAPHQSQVPICAAADPDSDYRWRAFNCGGPEIASFICELPVPAWALHLEKGCMMHALPALTAIYLPESAAIQLISDCGLSEIKKVMCTGIKSHDELIMELSCGTHLEDLIGITTTTTPHQDIVDTIKISIEDKQEHDVIGNVNVANTNLKNYTRNSYYFATPQNKELVLNEYNDSNSSKVSQKTTIGNLIQTRDSDLISDITTTAKSITTRESNSVVVDKFGTVSDTTNTSSGSSITTTKQIYSTDFPEKTKIYTQLSDHFIPPLVMAKSKASTDTAVVSIDRKHLQQAIFKLKYLEEFNNDITIPTSSTTTPKLITKIADDTKTTPSFIQLETTRQVAKKVPLNVVTNKDIFSYKPTKQKKYDSKRDNLQNKYITAISKPKNELVSTVSTIVTNSGITESSFITTTSGLFSHHGTTTDITKSLIQDNPILIDSNKNISYRDKGVNSKIEIYGPGDTNSNTNYNGTTIIIKNNYLPVFSDSNVLTSMTDRTESDVSNGMSIEPRPKPNRSRNLPSLSRHTMYPYFINRVLG